MGNTIIEKSCNPGLPNLFLGTPDVNSWPTQNKLNKINN